MTIAAISPRPNAAVSSAQVLPVTADGVQWDVRSSQVVGRNIVVTLINTLLA